MNLGEFSSKCAEVIDYFSNDISSLRTGRATPALVENIPIEAYGSHTPLVQLASISVPDPRTIVIQPWDPSILRDIERSIQKSDVQIQPIVDKDIIRMSMPPLTEENRKEIVKLLNQKAEASRVSIRQLREKTRTAITDLQKDGAIAEDVKFRDLKILDERMKEFSDRIKSIAETKETEIMKI